LLRPGDGPFDPTLRRVDTETSVDTGGENPHARFRDAGFGAERRDGGRGTSEEVGMRARAGIAAAAAVAVLAAGCGDDPGTGGSGNGSELSGKTIEVLAVWSDEEQASFERVLDVFEQRTGVTVSYVSGGDEVPTVLATRLTGGSPPDV